MQGYSINIDIFMWSQFQFKLKCQGNEGIWAKFLSHSKVQFHTIIQLYKHNQWKFKSLLVFHKAHKSQMSYPVYSLTYCQLTKTRFCLQDIFNVYLRLEWATPQTPKIGVEIYFNWRIIWISSQQLFLWIVFSRKM